MNLNEIYDMCLKAHALKWIEIHQETNPIIYLEMHGGPVITRCIEYYGLQQVVIDFIEKIQSER